MFDVKMLMEKHDRMEREFSSYASECQPVAEHCLPRHAIFNQGGENWATRQRHPRLLDSYGVQALEVGATAFENYVMPRGSVWQQLTAADTELMKLQHVAAWFEAKTQRLFELRNDQQSGFVQQTHESILSLLAFGGQSMWVDYRYDAWGDAVGLAYRSEHLGTVRIDEDWQGNVSRTDYVFRLSAREAVRRWGETKLAGCDKVLKDARDDKKWDNSHEFIHIVMPNDKIDKGRADWRGMPYVGCYISKSDKHVFDEGGYKSRPRTYSRLDRAPGQTYGQGRGMTVLPELRHLQDIAKDIFVAAELNSQPALAAPDDAFDMMINYGPGTISYGLMSDQGRKLVDELFSKIDLSEMAVIQKDLRDTVSRAFFADMFDVRQEQKTHITATATLARTQEKGILLSPLGRQETEWFSPMLERELELMARLGEFDDMPNEVREAGGAKTVGYDNPLNRMKMADQAAGYFRTVEALSPLMAYDQSIAPTLGKMFPPSKVVPAIAAINGVPASWRATDEELGAADAAEQEQIDLAQMTELLPALGKTAKDLSAAAPEGVGLV